MEAGMGAKKRAAAKRTSGATRRVAGGLPCSECGFVAKHAMGLGRHRASKHGAEPKRATAAPKAAPPGGAWMSREQAAEHVGVHYNTVRHWERRGLVRTMKRAGIRGIFVHGEDIERSAAGATLRGPIGRTVSIEELERRYAELVANLEKLLAATKRSQERVTNVRDAQARVAGGARGTAKAKAGRARPSPRQSRRSG
ncbi:MAG: hypothetical protein NVSMB57_08910 [Actinomycetota bacterium]